MDKISDLKKIVINTLDLNKAQDIITIDLKDKSSMADYMIIASGTSSRHIQSLSEQVLEKLKKNGVPDSKIEGKQSNEWKLVCLLYTSPSPRDATLARMPSSA